MSKQVPIKALNDREVNEAIVLLVSQLDVKRRNSCEEAAHSSPLIQCISLSRGKCSLRPVEFQTASHLCHTR